MAKRPKRILIVKNRAMGDSLMGLSTLDYIGQIFPDSKLFYAIPKWITPLYREVKLKGIQVIPLSLEKIKGWWQLFLFLRREKIDLVYEMHQSGRTQKFFSFYQKVFGVPYFFHNHHLGPEVKTGVVDQGVIKPLIQRDLDGAYSFLKEFSLSENKNIPHYLDYPPKISLVDSKKNNSIIFGIVATRESKKWPLRYFFDLAQEITQNYPEKTIKIPLSKSSSDLKTFEEIKNWNWPKNVEIVFWSLEELPLEMGKSHFYIGNDTGLKHLAVSLDIKTYTFFGPEPPLEWHPYDTKRHRYFYQDGLTCRTRTHHYCGLFECDSMICLNQFLPSAVFKLIDFD